MYSKYMLKKVPAFRINSVIKEKVGFSLKAQDINGGFLPGRKVIHYPSLKQIRLKDIKKMDSGEYILQVKGLKQNGVGPGDCIMPADWDINRGKGATFYCPSGRIMEKKKHSVTLNLTQGALGIETGRGVFSFSGYVSKGEFYDPIPLVKGGTYHFEGMEEPMILIGIGDLPKSQVSFVDKALTSWKDSKNLFREYLALELGLEGYASVPLEYADVTLPRCEKGDALLIRTAKYTKVSGALLKRSSAMGGLEETSLRGLEERVKDLMLERNLIVRSKGWLLPAEGDRERNLSPMARRELTVLREGSGRLSPNSIKNRVAQDNWKALGRMGLVRYHNDLIMTEDAYQAESDIILKSLKEKGAMELAELREFSSLSRREILVLLEWMEREGKITNKDDVREAIL